MDNWHDDAELEMYLRRYRPRAPAPLIAAATAGRGRRWPMAMLSAAAIVLAAVLVQLPHSGPVAPRAQDRQPFTMGKASRRLAEAGSWKAVIDEAGFRFPTSAERVPSGRSALEALSREELLQ